MSKEVFKIEVKRQTHKFNILGSEFNMNHENVNLATINFISMINLQGKPYWEEMKRQGIIVTKNLFEFLEEKLCGIKPLNKN